VRNLLQDLKSMLAKIAGAKPATERLVTIEDTSSPQPTPPAVANFGIGELVRHRHFPFRGVIFDVDPEFANSEEWWESIPEPIRPRKDQPFYHLLAENDESAYVAYVSQQNLVRDENGEPVKHPAAEQIFEPFVADRYKLKREHRH